METSQALKGPVMKGAAKTAGTIPWLGDVAALAVVLALFAGTCVWVNPLREMALDDDWAYALTVKHLLETGTYRLHDWAAANMPFQVYWGALFARLFGFSHAVLRVSTLVTAALGLSAFFFLARELGRGPVVAGLLTLGLLSSPLFLHLSFTFLTDVPFVAWLVVALLFYAKGLRRHSYGLVALASLAGAAAILIRQFGVAIPAGLFVVWLAGPERRRRLPLFALGMALPVLAGAWQVAAGTLTPNWTARLRVHDEAVFLGDACTVLASLFWRPTIALQYLALFALPFVLVGLAALPVALCRRRSRAALWGGRSPGVSVAALAGLAAWVVAAIFLGHPWLGAPTLMPFLPFHFKILYDLDFLSPLPFRLPIPDNVDSPELLLVTLLTAAGAVALGVVVVQRYAVTPGWKALPPGGRLLDVVTAFLLGLHLTFFLFADEYLLVLLPFVLLAGGQRLEGWLRRAWLPSALACLAVLALAAVWTRGMLAEKEALWRGSEQLRLAGVEPRQVTGCWEWDCFHGAFDDYLADINYRLMPGTVQEEYGLGDFFNRYLKDREAAARYYVYSGEPDQPVDEAEAERLAEIPFRDAFLRARSVYVEKKRPGGDTGKPPKEADDG